MPSNDRGYSIAELVIAMMIFSVVMALISLTFGTIVTNSSVIVKSTESDIGGLIGLELLRSDLEAAGFGLPWSLPDNMTYQETSLGPTVPGGYPDTAASSYNDTPPELPRAYNAGDQVGFNGSDYLVLKGTAVGMSRPSRSWVYLNYSSTGTIIRKSKSGMELEPNKGNRAIVLRSAVSSGVATRELVTAAPGSTAFTLVYDYPLPAGFLPKSKLDSYLVYGVALQAKDANSQQVTLSFPYNRADYYISPASRSKSCAPNTGTLYKTTIDHSGGQTGYPLLDCVADLQVLFVLEDEDGTPCLLTGFNLPEHDAEYVRNSLREVRLYVMAQQGRVDPGYSYPMTDPGKVISLGNERSWSRSDFLRNGWERYHWKVYSIVVQPKNL